MKCINSTVYNNCTSYDNYTVYNGTISNITDNNSSSKRVPGSAHTTAEIVLLSFIASAVSLFTIGGNLLVIIAFNLNKQLHASPINRFPLSLAVSDLCVGLFSMPLYTMYLLLGYWPLGPFTCDLWLSMDYTVSYASVANLVFISFDRYLSVTRPMTYTGPKTGKRVRIMIICAWLIPLLTWPPWTFAWPYIDGERTVPDGMCYIQFLQTNTYITIITSLVGFYIPVLVMVIVYAYIYREIKKRRMRLKSTFKSLSLDKSQQRFCKESSPDYSTDVSSIQSLAHVGDGTRLTCVDTFEATEGCVNPGVEVRDSSLDVQPLRRKHICGQRSDAILAVNDDQPATSINLDSGQTQMLQGSQNLIAENIAKSDCEITLSKKRMSFAAQTIFTVDKIKKKASFRRRQQLTREHRAARTMSTLLFAFIFTWTPYSVFAVSEVFCYGCIHQTLYAFGRFKYLPVRP